MTPGTNSDQVVGLGASALPPTSDQQTCCAELGKQAMLAFWRDLPHLLQDRPWQWVAYHGDRQLGFAKTGLELWQECVRQGLQPGEFLVRSIEPEDPSLILEGNESE